jgi:hypothetical protein
MAGGCPAIAKKVTADLDSDDEIIVRMKDAKCLEKDIAKRLTDKGRTTYSPKTIGTRQIRLKKAMAERQDELPDADLTDWPRLAARLDCLASDRLGRPAEIAAQYKAACFPPILQHLLLELHHCVT